MSRKQIYVSAAVLVLLMMVPFAGCSGGDDGGDAVDRLNEGLEAHKKGEFDKAEDAYRDVLDEDPDNVFALYDLGVVQQSTDRPADAEENYRKSLIVDPNFGPALFNLAVLRTESGAPEEAVELYRRVTTVEPTNAGAHFNLGLLLESLGRTSEAEAALSEASRLDPGLITKVAAKDIGPDDKPEDPGSTDGDS